jgi:hypothetical protein
MSLNNVNAIRSLKNKIRTQLNVITQQLPSEDVRRFRDAFKKNITASSSGYEFTDLDYWPPLPDHDQSWFKGCLKLIWGCRETIRRSRAILRERAVYNPVADRILDARHAADVMVDVALGKHSGILPSTRPGSVCNISVLWKQHAEAVGGGVIGRRFIARAKLVDQIGEYDLFEIIYHESGANKHTPQTGYVGRYRGTNIRGFGAKPETALSWTARQVVIHGTRKLTR